MDFCFFFLECMLSGVVKALYSLLTFTHSCTNSPMGSYSYAKPCVAQWKKLRFHVLKPKFAPSVLIEHN